MKQRSQIGVSLLLSRQWQSVVASLIPNRTKARAVAALLALSFSSISQATITIYTDEAQWRANVGAYSEETFEGFTAGQQISYLASLDINFDTLEGTTYPAIYAQNCGGNVFGSFTLMNFGYPCNVGVKGNLNIRPASGDHIFSVGYWNTGGNDATSLEFFDDDDQSLGSASSGFGFNFVGIISTVGAKRVEIQEAGGNTVFSIDNLQIGDGDQCGATKVLMDPTTNDGSFESNTVYNINFSPTTLPPVWTINTTGPGIGGLLSCAPHCVVLNGADGVDGLFADQPSGNVTTATSYDLLDATYPSVSAGDEFTWSFMVDSWSANSTATLKLNFGAGDVTVGTGIANDVDLTTFRTISGTYIATAADAAGGQLSVNFSITAGSSGAYGNVYGDDVRLSVLPAGACNQSPDSDGDGVNDDDDLCPDTAAAASVDINGCSAAQLDGDSDGISDDTDNCPDDANADQTDNDMDGLGDVCDDDDDNDGVLDGADNCSLVANADQNDADGDLLGDVCDADLDGDGLDNGSDNCPAAANPDQTDTDGDLIGDECDTDDDNDGLDDASDNCPSTVNPDQEDLDGDDIGDACDADLDGDGVENSVDNCPVDANTGQDNTDLLPDGGDACDDDDDEDGVDDGADNCPLIANPGQENLDGDGDGDACDDDLDGDGVGNSVDNCPVNANSGQSDLDGDGVGDTCDADIDGDGVDNGDDNCAATPLGDLNDANGCTIAQLCPCDGPRGTTKSWKNHGKYVSCVAHAANDFRDDGLITGDERGDIVSEAAQSSCGHH